MAIIPTLRADPCGRLEALLAIRDKVSSGGQIIEAEIEQGNGTRRRMRYGQANLADLKRLVIEAEDACNALNGCSRPSRFAIGGRVS